MAQLSSEIKDYRTSQTHVSPFSKTFPSFRFYSSFVWLVLNSGIRSKHGKYDNELWRKNSLHLLQVLEQIGVRFEITGLHHLKQVAPPYVIIANHMSTLETVVLPYIFLPVTSVTFIVKQSLLKYPFFGHILRSREPIAVNRISPRRDLKTVLQEGLDRLKRDISVIVFPQTTRTLFLDPHRFNTIGLKLAQRANVPIVPVALKSDVWGNGKYLKDFGRIDPSKKAYFAVGVPIQPQPRGRDEHASVIQFINGKLEEWKKAESSI